VACPLPAVAVTSVGAERAPLEAVVEAPDAAVAVFSGWLLPDDGFASDDVETEPLGGEGNVVLSSEEQDSMNMIDSKTSTWIIFGILDFS
jgi:hypothetical protein